MKSKIVVDIQYYNKDKGKWEAGSLFLEVTGKPLVVVLSSRTISIPDKKVSPFRMIRL